jgi:hypothetical protein
MFGQRFCCSLLGQRFCCSLSVMVHVWAEVLFVIWYGECFFHFLIWSTYENSLCYSLFRTSCNLAQLTYIPIFFYFCQTRIVILRFPVILFSVAHVNIVRRYIKYAAGWTTKGLIPDIDEIFLFSKSPYQLWGPTSLEFNISYWLFSGCKAAITFIRPLKPCTAPLHVLHKQVFAFASAIFTAT